MSGFTQAALSETALSHRKLRLLTNVFEICPVSMNILMALNEKKINFEKFNALYSIFKVYGKCLV